jgi:hypothetical protein
MALTRLGLNQSINLASNVTGTLATGNGGTGATSYTAGITVAEEWLLTSNKTSAGYIDANLAISGISGLGNINASMTQSSGVFTFPSTGIWSVGFTAVLEEGNQSSSDGIIRPEIYITTDNSNYSLVARTQEGVDGSIAEFSGTNEVSILFDVTNTSTHKCKFRINSLATNDRLLGSSSNQHTKFRFMRLGDT